MKKCILQLLALTLVGIMLYSCQNENDFIENPSNKISNINHFQDVKKLQNPYTVKNMRKALENIKIKLKKKQISGKRSISNLNISTSHYYIKFKPENEEQEGIIKRDSSMVLSDYPLDYEFTDDYLKNRPELPEGKLPTYWVAVPIGKTLPSNVPYEIIEELYIPEEDATFNSEIKESKKGGTRKGEINDNEDVLRHLLNEAYALTDNEEDLLKDSNDQSRWFFGSKWYPSGTLKIWDDNVGNSTTTASVFSHWEYYYCGGSGGDGNGNIDIQRFKPTNECRRAVYKTVTNTVKGKYVPLVGAQVLIRQWFTVRKGITDQNGYFKTSSVRGKATYIVQWERYQYSIRNGSLFQAETRGPKVSNQVWNHSIKGGDDEYHGMIHTAAHTYYYGSRFGLTSPPTNSFWKKQMKIAAREQRGTSSFSHARGDFTLGLLAHIHIKEWGAPSDKIFGTTIHELAHGAHQEFDASAYNSLVWKGWISPCAPSAESCDDPGPTGASARRTLETWATTVEILFALNRYRDMFNQPDYKYYFKNRQDLPINTQPYYTSLGYDLIDNINQRIDITPTYSGIYPRDRVSGYTIKQIENSLKNTNSWEEWKEHIKEQNPNNLTNQYIDELFNNWN